MKPSMRTRTCLPHLPRLPRAFSPALCVGAPTFASGAYPACPAPLAPPTAGQRKTLEDVAVFLEEG